MTELALALTIVVEGLIAAAILRKFVWLESTAIQLTTWPVAQWLSWRGGNFWMIEAGVFVVEIALWRIVLPVTWRKAIVVSFVSNATTTLIALLLFSV